MSDKNLPEEGSACLQENGGRNGGEPSPGNIAAADLPEGQEPYKVGYKKPPLHTRFKESGNPKGRPRGRRSFSTEVREVLNEKLEISENGKMRKVTVTQATLMRLRYKALSGDIRAMDKLLAMATNHFPDEPTGNTQELLDEDLEILEAARLMVKEEEVGGDR